MGFDIESFVCALVVICIGWAFRDLVCVIGEYPSCEWLGWYFLAVSVLIAIFMTVVDE